MNMNKELYETYMKKALDKINSNAEITVQEEGNDYLIIIDNETDTSSLYRIHFETMEYLNSINHIITKVDGISPCILRVEKRHETDDTENV